METTAGKIIHEDRRNPDLYPIRKDIAKLIRSAFSLLVTANFFDDDDAVLAKGSLERLLLDVENYDMTGEQHED